MRHSNEANTRSLYDRDILVFPTPSPLAGEGWGEGANPHQDSSMDKEKALWAS